MERRKMFARDATASRPFNSSEIWRKTAAVWRNGAWNYRRWTISPLNGTAEDHHDGQWGNDGRRWTIALICQPPWRQKKWFILLFVSFVALLDWFRISIDFRLSVATLWINNDPTFFAKVTWLAGTLSCGSDWPIFWHPLCNWCVSLITELVKVLDAWNYWRT